MSHTQNPEPRNLFYLLLLLASLFFVVTALAYAVVPMLQEKSTGSSDPSFIRTSLSKHGWVWLSIELGFMLLFGLASMLLDRSRLRRLQITAEKGTMPQNSKTISPEVRNGSSREDREVKEGD